MSESLGCRRFVMRVRSRHGSGLTAAAIGVGGTVIVGITGFLASVRNTNKTTALTLRAVQLTEQGQVTDRYTRAIEQLGSDNLGVRIGGIYALGRIADDSPRDHPTVMEVLATFIRDVSQEPLRPPSGAKSGTKSVAKADKGPRLPGTARPDVDAAITVIGRRSLSKAVLARSRACRISPYASNGRRACTLQSSRNYAFFTRKAWTGGRTGRTVIITVVSQP